MDRLSRRQFSSHMKSRAPQDSLEWRYFNNAETYYELAECLKNKGPKAKSARNKAKRFFDKGWSLFEERINGD